MLDNIFTILVGLFVVWGIYLTLLVMSSSILFTFLTLSKKLFFSQANFIGTFIISLFVFIFSLYIPLNSSNDITSDIIGIFIFLPTIFFYNKTEKKEVMKSSIKIALLLLFIKLFLNKEFPIDIENLKFLPTIKNYFKAVIFSIFYTEILKVLSIVINYLKEEDNQK